MSGSTSRGLRPRLLLCILLTALAASCGGRDGATGAHSDAVVDEYLVRVARVLDSPLPLTAAEAFPRYPRRRQLLLAVPETDIDVAEFVDVHRCDAGGLVGYRNSPLGRVQLASQRLGYEVALLAAIEDCPEPPDWMRQLALKKANALPSLFWNATFAAAEMRTALGSAKAPPAADLGYLLRGLGDALAGLEQGQFDQELFEATLAQLRSGSWGGAARASWARWRAALNAVAGMLDAAQPRFCLSGRPTPRSSYLMNVFERFYVRLLQPELATLLRQDEVWVRELARLLERLDGVPPEAFRDWYRAVLDPEHPSSEWARTRRAVADHAEAWQRMLASCGIEPGHRLGEH